jgi:hypothetical protein
MRSKETIRDMRAVERETNAEHDSAGMEALVQSGFSEQEIPVLLRLRQGLCWLQKISVEKIERETLNSLVF